MEIKENISLKGFTYFKIGGNARYFCAAKTIKDLSTALDFARKNNMEIFVLGNGSKILVSDNGFEGLVIKNEMKFIEMTEKGNNPQLEVASGVMLTELVDFCLKNSLSGIEKLFGIPATIGGMIYKNAGAHGYSIGSITEKIRILNLKKNKIEEIIKDEKTFGYRTSIFQKKQEIILSAFLRFKKEENSKIKETISEVTKKRMESQPINYPSVGSIFKNIPAKNFSKEILEKEDFPIVNCMVSAGLLIEKMGLKGIKQGDAQISEKHAGFIINLGNAKANDVRFLIDLIKEKAREKFHIEMKEEVEYLGKFF
ncbi:MAG: UDP-N-acetylmuramate dehydrogenase [bacterium]|nr:UDP-N-acetylmuramate dehydrogenase [bacterium]